ncbi:ComEC/Rec2 family competence protein [Paraglaciecola aquimarina]|uniref:ComEC/Rec2 family competence protein n=1 Tax=Paraglaciecola aquimarina TaxID=1235557 RepID=A0ABU3SYE8_9ALTE|nr:ComEC/Rec2 family competence protein [Paraglaciecola aquimarina]MDU0355039.1 ComEC/Rec2 family competence protein [Paraglaciecola aquimarina]
MQDQFLAYFGQIFHPVIVFFILTLILICAYAKKYANISSCLLGIVWMASVGHWQCTLQPSSQEISQPILLTGQIVSLIDTPNNTRFNLDVSHMANSKLLIKRRFRISWKVPPWRLTQGQVIQVQVKLKPAYGLANEGGFNYQQWLFSEGIQATGYVKDSEFNQLVKNKVSTRQWVLDRIQTLQLSEQRWIIALTIGFRGLLEPQDWMLVQRTGIAHLIAISGLHLALVASMSYFFMACLAGIIVSRVFHWHKFNVHKFSVIGTIFTTYCYAGLAGFGLPTLRAWIMLLLFTGILIINRNMSSLKVLLLGISSFILLFPLSLFGASFWLSFSAVIIIWFIFWRWPVRSAGFSIKAVVASMLRIQLGLSLLMLPIVAWQFSYISFVSPVVNIVAVPFVTFILVPLCLLAVICLFLNETWAEWLFQVCNTLLAKTLPVIEWLSHQQWTVLDLAAVPLLVWAMALTAVSLLFFPLSKSLKKACIF